MNSLFKRSLLRTFLVAILVVGSSIAFALDLDQAKAQGLVGERTDGMLGAVASSPSAEVSALVNSINSKRKDKYRKIAKDTGTTLVQVQALAGRKAQKKTQPGHFIQTQNGSWKRK